MWNMVSWNATKELCNVMDMTYLCDSLKVGTSWYLHMYTHPLYKQILFIFKANSFSIGPCKTNLGPLVPYPSSQHLQQKVTNPKMLQFILHFSMDEFGASITKL